MAKAIIVFRRQSHDCRIFPELFGLRLAYGASTAFLEIYGKMRPVELKKRSTSCMTRDRGGSPKMLSCSRFRGETDFSLVKAEGEGGQEIMLVSSRSGIRFGWFIWPNATFMA